MICQFGGLGETTALTGDILDEVAPATPAENKISLIGSKVTILIRIAPEGDLNTIRDRSRQLHLHLKDLSVAPSDVKGDIRRDLRIEEQ